MQYCRTVFFSSNIINIPYTVYAYRCFVSTLRLSPSLPPEEKNQPKALRTVCCGVMSSDIRKKDRKKKKNEIQNQRYTKMSGDTYVRTCMEGKK